MLPETPLAEDELVRRHCYHEGHILKRRDTFKQWRSRFCVLDGDVLRYYKPRKQKRQATTSPPKPQGQPSTASTSYFSLSSSSSSSSSSSASSSSSWSSAYDRPGPQAKALEHKGLKARGVVHLRGARVRRLHQKERESFFPFILFHPNTTKIYYFACETDEEARSWIKAIAAAAASLDGSVWSRNSPTETEEDESFFLRL